MDLCALPGLDRRYSSSSAALRSVSFSNFVSFESLLTLPPNIGGMYGKLGHGNEAGHSTPKRVDALAGLAVSQIACGSRHTTAVVSSGALYSWGDKEVSFLFVSFLEFSLRGVLLVIFC